MTDIYKDEPTPWRDEETLRRLYHREELSLSRVADRLGCDDSTVLKWMRHHGIDRRTHRDAVNLSRPPLEERFWSKVDRGDDDECWEWVGASDEYGYGQIQIDGVKRQAHRVSAELDGRPPGDQWALHHCDNPPCVNPNHLYIGDGTDNIRDAYDRGRLVPKRGEGHPAAKLTEDEVIEIRQRYEAGDSPTEIAGDFGVESSTVSSVLAGDTWGWLSDRT